MQMKAVDSFHRIARGASTRNMLPYTPVYGIFFPPLGTSTRERERVRNMIENWHDMTGGLL